MGNPADEIVKKHIKKKQTASSASKSTASGSDRKSDGYVSAADNLVKSMYTKKGTVYKAKEKEIAKWEEEEERRKQEEAAARELALQSLNSHLNSTYNAPRAGAAMARDAVNRGLLNSGMSFASEPKEQKTPNNQYAMSQQKTALSRERARLDGLWQDIDVSDTRAYSDWVKRSNAVNDALIRLESEMKAADTRAAIGQFEKVRGNADFEEYAQKGAAVETAKPQNFWTLSPLKAMLNPQEGFNRVKSAKQPDDTFSDRAMGVIDHLFNYGQKYAESPLVYMTQDETDVYNYLLAKDKENGTKESDAYIEKLYPMLNERQATANVEGAQEWAAESAGNAALGSVASVLRSPANFGSYLDAAMQKAMGNDVDINRVPAVATRMNNAVRGTVGGNINEDVQGVTGSRFLGNASEFLYQVGLSMADAGLIMALTGGTSALAGVKMGTGTAAGALSSALMGGSAASSAMIDAKERGGNDTQALTVGALAGVAEALFEKVSIEKFISEANAGTKGAWVLNILRQMGVEGYEEGATEVANIISDALLMGNLSQYKDMTAGEIALQVAQAALGGVISGAGMGGIAQLGNYATRKANERAAAAPAAEPAAEADPIREAAMQAAIAQEEQTEQPVEKAAPMRAAKPAEQTPVQEAQKRAESAPAMEDDNDTPELAAPTRAVTMTRRDNAVNTSYDEAVEVVGIDSVDDGKVYVLDSNDDVIALNDVDFSDSNTAALYRAAGSFDTATAQRFVQEYDGRDVQQYAQAFSSVYNDGKAGIDYNTTLTQRASASTLTESQRITAHAGGQKVASLPNVPKKFTPGLVRAYTKASLTNEGRENTKKFRRQLQALDIIGKKYNREIVLVSSLKGMTIGGVTITGNVNGAYDPTTKRIYIAADAQDGAFAYVAMHELVHSIKDSDSKAYDRLRDVVFEALEASGEDVDALIDYQINSVYKGEIDRDGAIEEVISNTAPTVLMDEQFARDLYNNDRTLFDKIREFFEELKQVFAELTQSGSWAQDTALDEESVAKIAKVFDKVAMETAAQPDMNNLAAVDAAPTQTDAGIVIDESGVKFSINTKDAWAKHMREAYGNTADVRSAIDFVNDISQVIMDNKSLRDYMVRGDIPYSKIGPIRSNVEYKITFDLDTLCQRVWQYAALRDSIIDMAGRPLTKKESRQLIDYIEKMGGQIPCRYCYVEGKRALFADSYLNFINFRRDVMNEADDDVARTKMYSYDAKTGKLGAAAEKVFDEWRGIRSDSNTYNPQSLEEHYVNFQQLRNAVIDFLEENYPGDIAQTRTSEDGYNFLHYEVRNSNGRKVGAPAMAKQVLRHFGAMSGADANARASFVARKIIQPWMQARYEGVESVKNTRGSKFDARVLDLERMANNYAASASSAHLFEPYQPYTDQLSHVSKDVLKYVNAMGGVRIHSSNDFQMRNIVDYLQFFAEMASMNLMSHSYTKNLTFAEIAGKLGGRVNVSIALNGDFSTGIQENISEGAPWGEARALQKRNPNVGVMAMITNDDQLSFVLNTDWVQMTIPFHSSGIESEYTDALRWTSYQSIQNERPYADSTMRDELKADGVDVSAKLAGRELREMYAKHFGKTLITDKNGKYITPHFFPHDTQVTTQGGKTVIIPGHHNDAKRYFELCEQFGVRPRFDGAMVQDRNGKTIPAVEHPNYVKLIKETARTDSEQTAISMDALTDPEFREWLVERMELEVPAERNSSTGYRDVMGIGKTFIENVINNPAAKDLPYGKLPAALEERIEMLGDMSNAPREEFDVRFTGGEPVRGVDYEVVKSKPKLAQMTDVMKARAPKFSARDTEYMDAVNRGDMETAQKMVDTVAKEAGFPVKAYHGTPTGGFTQFDRTRIGSNSGVGRGSFSFTSDKATADAYANAKDKSAKASTLVAELNKLFRKHASEDLNELINGDPEADVEWDADVIISDGALDGGYIDFDYDWHDYDPSKYANREEARSAEAAAEFEGTRKYLISELRGMQRGAPESTKAFFDEALAMLRNATSERTPVTYAVYLPSPTETYNANANNYNSEAWKAAGSAAEVTVLHLDNGEDRYFVKSPESIKSADPVTYDDNGDVIPLSQRFNPENADIRFSAKDPARRERDARTAERIAEGRKQSAAQQKLEGKHDAEVARLKGRIAELEQQVKDERAAGQINAAIERKAGRQAAEDARTAERIAEGRVRSEERQKAADALAEQKQKAAEREAALRQRKDDRIATLEGRIVADQVNRNVRTETQKYTERITANAKTLTAWLIRPTDDNHVPETMRNRIAKFIETIDFSDGSKFTNKSKDWKLRLYQLRDTMQSVDASSDAGLFLDIDPDLTEFMTQFLDQMPENVQHVGQMDVKQLKDLDRIMQTIKRTVVYANKNRANARYAQVSALGVDSIDQMNFAKGKSKFWQTFSSADKFFNVQQLDSFSFFEGLGDAAESVLEALRTGFDTKVKHVQQAVEYVKPFTKGLNMRKISGKSAATYDIKLDSGKRVQMTTAQIMELYELLKREQARGHIFGSGIRIADISRGKLSPDIKQVEPVQITVEDAQRIVDNLSDKQKQLADRLAWFMGDQCAAWGNETSLLMYGYKKFNEQNYYPIHSDSNYTQTNDKNDKSQNGAFAALKNLGMTKQVQQGAHNPIIIGDIFDTFTQHVDDMASYNGLMPALSDAMKWYNYKETKSTGEMISVKRAMERRAGIHAKGYFETFIKQLNGVNDRGERIGVANWLTSNAKAASVGANLRVVLQQPTSYIRAAAVIDPKYLAKGVAGKPMVADAKKYCPIALWKSWGFYDISVGKDMRSLLFNDSNFDEKLREWGMAPAGLADEVTWGTLFRACYAEQRDLHPDWSEVRQKEAAGKRLAEIVDRTQVVDSPFHKSQLMRSSDGLVKMQTAFMAEPTKTYNLLRSALVNMIEKNDKESRRRFARTAVTWLLSATAVSAAAAIADVGRDDDEDESTMEKYWAALGANMLDNVNPLNMVPFVKDVFSLLQGYEPSRIDMQAADKLINVGKVWLKQLNAEKGEKPYTHWYMAYQTAQALSSVTGIPVGNLMREVDAIASMFGADLKTKTSVATATERYEKLYGAIVDGNTEKVERIEAALRESEKSPKDIDSGIAKVLAEQDERIAEAYELREAGDIKALTALRKELMQTFDEETVDRAINLYENAAEKAPTEKNLDEELDAPLYDYADMEVVALQAFETGDTADLLTVIEEIKADSDASDPDAAVKSKATTLFKPVYVEAVKKGYAKKAARIKKILTDVFGTKPETIDKWIKD